MKAIKFTITFIATFTLCSLASAHELPFRGKTTMAITGAQNNALTFDVSGRVTPLLGVTGTGRLIVGPSGEIFGGATFVDHHGDKLFIDFEATREGQGGFTGTFEITGGTGHWIGHVGDGTISGTVGAATAVIIFNGVIDH